jgi:hypothetical protein
MALIFTKSTCLGNRDFSLMAKILLNDSDQYALVLGMYIVFTNVAGSHIKRRQEVNP